MPVATSASEEEASPLQPTLRVPSAFTLLCLLAQGSDPAALGMPPLSSESSSAHSFIVPPAVRAVASQAVLNMSMALLQPSYTDTKAETLGDAVAADVSADRAWADILAAAEGESSTTLVATPDTTLTGDLDSPPTPSPLRCAPVRPDAAFLSGVLRRATFVDLLSKAPPPPIAKLATAGTDIQQLRELVDRISSALDSEPCS